MKLYVAQGKGSSGDGSKAYPFRTITEAAEHAGPGDEVLVAPGIYRETVRPSCGGSEDARIVFSSTEKYGAVITGAESVRFWESEGDNVFWAVIPDSAFGGDNPFDEAAEAEPAANGGIFHAGEVYLNGQALLEVASRQEVWNTPQRNGKHEKGPLCWYCEKSEDLHGTKFYVNFMGYDPNHENVEISVRRSCFLAKNEGAGYITLSGFKFVQTAGGCEQDGMVRVPWSKGWIIEDCEMASSKGCGISFAREKNAGHSSMKYSSAGYVSVEDKSSGYVKNSAKRALEAVCSAVNEGWDKEKLGAHRISRCDIHDLGSAGIAGDMGAAFSVIEDNYIHHIGQQHKSTQDAGSGIKLYAAMDTIIRRNRIAHCSKGVWLTGQAQGIRISQNLFHDNTRKDTVRGIAASGEDLFAENSHGPTLVDNNLLLSGISCRLPAQGIALVHDLIAGALLYAGQEESGSAEHSIAAGSAAYHVPHGVKIAGFSEVTLGDLRFCNNVFLKTPEDIGAYAVNSGENGKDTEKVLPVWMEGNFYFNGAVPCSTEKDAMTDQKNTASWRLLEEHGKCIFLTDLFAFLPPFCCRMISTETLGTTFVPEQKFEEPDGTFLMLNMDLCGVHRGMRPTAGPFEEPAERFCVFSARTEKMPGHIDGVRPPRIEAAPEILLCSQAEPAKDKDVQEKENSREETDNSREGTDNKRALHCQIAFTDCDGISVICKEKSRLVKEIFIEDNTVWMHLQNDRGIMEIDCVYGISHYVPFWSMEAEDTRKATRSEGSMALARCLAALLRAHIDGDLQNPEVAEQQVARAQEETMRRYGISLRFSNRQLRFVKERRFLSLQQAAELLSRASGNVIAEEVDS